MAEIALVTKVLCRVLLLLCVLVASGCSGLVAVRGIVPEVDGKMAIAAYERVLARYVDSRGQVDFHALADNRDDLETYVNYVARAKFAAFNSRDALLAHYLNSYNALSMFNVLDMDIPETHAGWRKVRAFVLRKFRIGGDILSLYEFENEVIRPLGEPRVHFALNCSARGCPRLPRLPFKAETLQQQLEHETRFFFSEPRNLQIDHAGQRVYVSAILQFYPEDFAPRHAPDLATYIGRYAGVSVPRAYAVRFIPYDWTIADSRRQ